LVAKHIIMDVATTEFRPRKAWDWGILETATFIMVMLGSFKQQCWANNKLQEAKTVSAVGDLVSSFLHRNLLREECVLSCWCFLCRCAGFPPCAVDDVEALRQPSSYATKATIVSTRARLKTPSF
jgi:hypothetical protein